MIHLGALFASILAKGLGIEIKFIDKSTGKTKTSTKTISKTANTPVIKTGGKHNTVNVFINNGQIAPDSKSTVTELRKLYDEKKVNYLLAPSKEKLTKYREFETRVNKNKVITTFMGILPDRHIALIKTGLYIRILMDENRQDEVNKLYANLINYSSEERYIINLASANHYAHYILPTFNQFKDIKDGLKRFLEHYQKIIKGDELALFVHRNMSGTEITKNVIQMAEKNLKYGVTSHKIYVHATGASNVDTLNDAYISIKKIFPQASKKRVARDMPNLTIKIPFYVNKLTTTEKNQS